jgi:sialic acid synthase SpsE
MISGIRIVESALGSGIKYPAASETNTADVARKSLVAAIDIPAGLRLSESMIRIQRPGTGLPPAMLPYILERTVRTDVAQGTLLTWEMLQ